jgi:[ribosomal protein S18]-alanine N-acetyltransferase
MNVSYTFQKMTAIQAREILTWRYTRPYAVYNPDEATLEEGLAVMLDPRNAYHAIYNGTTLVGFCCFGEDAQVLGGDYSLPDTLDIGLGMQPELTGQGKGTAFLAAILEFAQRQYRVKYFRATIAAFNRRSQRIFEKAGFQYVQNFMRDGVIPFVVMVKDAAEKR